jgi:ubiquinone/menaquinone biosynthesis C-methylase UbiE
VERIKKSIDVVIAPWKDSPYYDNAEKWIGLFWDEDTVFRKLFDQLDLMHAIELAVGHGRHAEIVAKMADEIIVMDVFDENLDVCKERLKNFDNVKYKKCEGSRFDGIDDEWATSIYCYDAMVHFSPDIVESYLMDTNRVLKPGGMALYHHSNYEGTENQHYGSNPHARNIMTRQLFAELCKKSNLDIVESVVFDWGGVKNLDCVTLVKK